MGAKHIIYVITLIYNVSNCSVEKGYLCQQACKWHYWHVNVYFTEQSIKQRGGLMELNFESLEIQKWNIPTDKAQRANKKIRVICLFIVFTSGIIVIKMSNFFIFSSDNSKKLVIVWAKYLNAPERFYWILLKNGIFDRLLRYQLWNIEGRNIKKKMLSQQKIPRSCIFKGWHFTNSSSESNIP